MGQVCAEKQEEQEEEEGNCKTKMGMEARGCGRCARFLTDREQRKVNASLTHEGAKFK